MTVEASQHAPFDVPLVDFSTLLKSLDDLSASFLKKGYYAFEESEEIKEIGRKLTEMGVEF